MHLQLSNRYKQVHLKSLQVYAAESQKQQYHYVKGKYSRSTGKGMMGISYGLQNSTNADLADFRLENSAPDM